MLMYSMSYLENTHSFGEYNEVTLGNDSIEFAGVSMMATFRAGVPLHTDLCGLVTTRRNGLGCIKIQRHYEAGTIWTDKHASDATSLNFSSSAELLHA